MHKRLLFTGAIEENGKNKMATGFPHAENRCQNGGGQINTSCAVLLIHSFVSRGRWYKCIVLSDRLVKPIPSSEKELFLDRCDLGPNSKGLL